MPLRRFPATLLILLAGLGSGQSGSMMSACLDVRVATRDPKGGWNADGRLTGGY